jgi:hypothetical protein
MIKQRLKRDNMPSKLQITQHERLVPYGTHPFLLRKDFYAGNVK